MIEKNNSLNKALKVLDLFLKEEKITVNYILKQTGYSKTAVYRMLSTLEESHYIYKDKSSNAYLCGIKLFFLGRKVDNYEILVNILDGPIEELSGRVGFTVAVSILENNESVNVMRKDNYSHFSLVPRTGTRMKLHSSATGKVLVCFSPDREHLIAQLTFEAYTPNTIKSREVYEKALAVVEKEQLAYDNEELVEGLFCVAAPVLNRDGRVLCAVSVTGYKVRLLEELEMVKASLRETVNRIESQMP